MIMPGGVCSLGKDTEFAGHPQMNDHGVAAVGVKEQIFRVPSHAGDG